MPYDDEIVGTGKPADGFDDEIVKKEEPGLVTSFKRGLKTMQMGYNAHEAYGASEMVKNLDRLEAEGDTPELQALAKKDLMFANHYNRWKVGGQKPETLAEIRKQQLGEVDTNMGQIRTDSSTVQNTLPTTAATQEFHATKTTGEALSRLAQDPFEITGNVVAESLGSQALTLPLVIGAGVTMGPAGVAATSGASSFMNEYGSGVLELLTASGVDVNDPQAVTNAMTSPEFKAAMANKQRKAAVVGSLDALAGGVAGATLGKTVIRNIAAQTGVQMVLGATGEAAGSAYAGEVIKPSAVIAEMIGEIPGGLTDTAPLLARKALNANALTRTANSLDEEVITGTTPGQKPYVAETKNEHTKPRLNKVQSLIVTQAAELGIDPTMALAVAGIETGGKYNPDAQNPKSTAHGVFQMLDATWEAIGGGDRNDVHTQVANGLKLLAETDKGLSAQLGRKLEPHESYMGHLLGQAGAKSILQADPALSMLEAVKRFDPRNAEAIVDNNGMRGMTVAQATDKWKRKVNEQIVAAGGDPLMNTLTHAGKDADAVPNEDATGNEIESGLEDLDEMFEEMEAEALTEADIAAALAESDADVLADPIEAMDTNLLNEEIDSADATFTVGPTTEPAVLDRQALVNDFTKPNGKLDLTAASNYVSTEIETAIADGRDVSLWIEGKPRTITGVVRGLMQDDEGKRWGLAGVLMPMPNDHARIEIGGIADTRADLRADSGVSMDEAGTRQRYANPNDQWVGAIQRAPIVAGDDSATGLTLNERPLRAGEVLALGTDSAHTPIAYMRKAQETVQDAIAKFAPSARVALTFRTEKTGGISSSAPYNGFGIRNRAAAGRGLYNINLRNATNIGIGENSTRNPTTLSKIVSSTWHEIGHVVADEQMTKNMSPELKQRFRSMGKDDYFTEQELASLPPQQAAVLSEYNSLKWKTLNDPNFTGEDFGMAWLGPWKLEHGWGGKKGLVSFAKKYFGETSAQALQMPARVFAEKMHLDAEILSPHEYMAEQMARYAYSNKLDQNSSLGSWEFFRNALAAMRAFFQQLKRGGEVRPGVAFAEWVDSLTATSQSLGTNKALPPRPTFTPEQEAKVRQAKELIVAKTAAPKLEPSILPKRKTRPEAVAKVAVKEYSAQQNEALLLLAGRLRFIAKDDAKKYQHYMDMVRNNQLAAFKADLALYIDEEIADQVRLDTDNSEDRESWRDIELNLPKMIPEKFNRRMIKHGFYLIRQLQKYTITARQLAAMHPEVAGLQMKDMLMSNYKAFKNKLEFKGLQAADRWSKLGAEQHGLLERAMKEEHYAGRHLAELAKVNQTYRFVPSVELAEYAAAKGLDEDTVQVWLDAKNAHISHMNALQNVLKKKLAKRLKGKPKTLQVRIYELGKQFDEIRQTPFLPQSRFGPFALQVKEKGPDGDRIVHVEFFENISDRDAAKVQLQKAAGPQRKVQETNYENSSQVLRTLPPKLLGTFAEEFDLTELQRAELKEIGDATTLNPTTRRYSAPLAAITGANKNLAKNFADFMWHSSNNIAKLHYREPMEQSLMLIQQDMYAARDEGDTAYYDQLARILSHAKEHVDHMMNPQDEWQVLRAIVVVKLLWGNLKTSLANLTAMKDVWALAATQQGLAKGSFETNKTGLKVLQTGIESAMNRVMRQPVEGSQVFAPDTLWAMDQAKSDGLIDESYAAQLATFANQGNLSRLNVGNSFMKKAIWAGMYPTHLIETFVRRTQLVVQFENYMKQGATKQEAYMKARRDTFLFQGDNTILNRPQFMRGKAANFLIFYGWMQNQLYLLSGAQERARNYRDSLDKGLIPTELSRQQARKQFYKVKWGGETLKMWMGWALLGGAMGMPGAEDLDAILELVAKKFFGTRFSLKDYAYAMAKEISDNAAAYGMDINPRSLVHGMGADMSLLGIGPSVDVSRSLGIGNVTPFLGGLDQAGGKGSAFLLGALGPLGAVLKQVEDVFSDDPSMLKKTALFMPNTVSGIAKAAYEWENGVRAPNGGKITVDRKTGDVRDLTTGENLVRLMGFQPEIIAANKEVHWMQQDVQNYWKLRRNTLVTQMFEARLQNNREAIADTNQALQDFNEQAPAKLRISHSDMRKSLKRKDSSRAAQERRKSREKKFQAIDDDIEDTVLGR